MADLVTLATLRAQVRAQGAVRVNTSAIDAMINAGITRLYRKIAVVAPDYLTLPTPWSTSVSAGSSSVDLTGATSDVWMVRGVDIDGGGGAWVPIERFAWSRRGNTYSDAFSRYLPQDGRLTSTQYHVVGNTLMLTPEPQSALTLRVWYITKPARLVLDTDTWDAVAGWEEYPVLYALVKFAASDEWETEPFARQLGAVERDIMREVSMRDSTQPHRVRDVRGERRHRLVRV